MHSPSQLVGVYARPLTAARKPRVNTIGVAAFFSISALCMMNINFLTRAFLGTEQVFSVLYLLACMVLLYAFRLRIGPALGAPGRLWVLAILMFLAISTRMGLGIDKAYFMSPQSNLYRICFALLITVAASLGARHLVMIGRLQVTLRILFGFTVLAALTIVLTKMFPGILVYVGRGNQDRAAGFFSDPNRAGQAVCMSAAFGFGCLAGEASKWKVFVYAGLITLVPCLFLTYSRSSIVSMAFLVLLQVFISPIWKRKESLIAVLIVATAIPVGVGFVLNRRASFIGKARADAQAQQERMESLFRLLSGNFDQHKDTGGRIGLAIIGLRYFAENPVIGAGFRKLAVMEEVGLGCHNTILRVFGEAGFFAGLLFVGAIGYFVLSGWRCKIAQIKCLVIGFASAYTCACMVGHTLLTNRLANVSMGICFGLLTGAAALHRQQQRQKAAANLVAKQLTR